MGLDSVGTEIYTIHGYFRRLTVGQRTLGFWGVTLLIPKLCSMQLLKNECHLLNTYLYSFCCLRCLKFGKWYLVPL